MDQSKIHKTFKGSIPISDENVSWFDLLYLSFMLILKRRDEQLGIIVPASVSRESILCTPLNN